MKRTADGPHPQHVSTSMGTEIHCFLEYAAAATGDRSRSGSWLQLRDLGIKSDRFTQLRIMKTSASRQVPTKLILFAMLALSLAASSCGKKPGSEKSLNPELAGTWNATLKVNDAQLRLVLKISKAENGSLSATMDSPDQGAKDLPVTAILFNNPAFKLEMEGLGAAFNGNLNRKGTEISGNWEQGPRPFPLVFRRAPASASAASSPELSYASSPGAVPDIRGYWKGTLDVQGTKLRLALKIGRAANGTFSGTMDSLDQGAREIPITTVTFKTPEVKLEWKLLNASFTGTLSQNGQSMTGQWTQMGRPLPLVFERANEPVSGGPAEAELSFVAPAGSPAIQGHWKGELEIGQAVLRLALKIGKATDGAYHGTMDSIDQGAKGIPMSSITFTAPAVRLEWSGLGAQFEGTVNDEGTELTGTFNQGPVKNVPLTFERTAPPGTNPSPSRP